MKSANIAKSLLSIGLCIAFLAAIVFIFQPDTTNVELENNGAIQKITGSTTSNENIIELEDVQSYYIDTSFIDVHLDSSDNESAYASYKGEYDMDITADVNLNQGYCLIEITPTDILKNIGSIFDHSDLYIYLPQRILSTVSIESFASEVNVKNISADKFITDLTATDLEIKNCTIFNAVHQSFASNAEISLNNSLVDANMEVTAGNLDLSIPKDNFSFSSYSSSFMSNTSYDNVFEDNGNPKKEGLFNRISKVKYNNAEYENTQVADITTDVVFGNININRN